jgi:RNA-binding protein YlmH
VEVEFEPVERVDLTLEPPVTLSVRGYGRFILRSFDGETRKGRLRMRADKLI